jgi:hypothetical protein
MLDVNLCNILTEIQSTGITEAKMERSGVDFTATNALNTAISQFTALVLITPLQPAAGDA